MNNNQEDNYNFFNHPVTKFVEWIVQTVLIFAGVYGLFLSAQLIFSNYTEIQKQIQTACEENGHTWVINTCISASCEQ